MSISTLAILLGVPKEQVLAKLQEPGVIRGKLGISEQDTVVVRDVLRRVYISADGTIAKDEVIEPQASVESPVKQVIITEHTQRLLDVLRKRQEAQDRFRADFPDASVYLDAYLMQIGCGICRGRVSELLRTDTPRSKLFVEYLESLTPAPTEEQASAAPVPAAAP